MLKYKLSIPNKYYKQIENHILIIPIIIGMSSAMWFKRLFEG